MKALKSFAEKSDFDVLICQSKENVTNFLEIFTFDFTRNITLALKYDHVLFII